MSTTKRPTARTSAKKKQPASEKPKRTPRRVAAKEPEVALPEDPAMFRRPRGDLAAIRFHIAPPERERLLLTRLGDPPGWRGPPTFLEALGVPVAAAAAKARAIASGEEPIVPEAGGTGHR